MTTATDLRDFPPVEENIERPETLSQTLLAKHDRCPRSAFLYRKLDGGTASSAMDRGSAFHEVAEQATQMMLKQGEPTIPGEVAREMADAIMAEHPEWVLPAEEQDAVRLMSWNWAEATALDPKAIIGVEVPLELEIGGFKVTCRVDRMEVFGSTLYLYDYKTSLNIRKREEVQRGFQGQMYALAALEGIVRETGLSIGAGINDVWFYEVYPRYRTDEGPLVAKEGAWTRTELAEFKVSLERNIAAFEESLTSGKWDARDGSHCSECPAQSECPIPAHLRAVEEITTVAEAEAAFSRKMALDREGRSLQAGLRGWVAENGPIYTGDLAFDASLSQSKSVKDWDGLSEAIRRAVQFGVPFLYDEHIKVRTSTKYGKRRMTEEEIDDAG